jgi:hypothetical protein
VLAIDIRNTGIVIMGMFKKERAAVIDATQTAKQGINTALVVATAALVIATIALVVGVLK